MVLLIACLGTVSKTMVNFTTGDIFKADAEALVNTVNCVGVMGRGLALRFKQRFPENFKAYAAACKRKQVQPGKMFVYETGTLTDPKYIINFPTKRHWRGKSRIEDIDSGLLALTEEIRQRRIRSIAVPALGSSLGGLDWDDVRQRIDGALKDIPGLRVTVYEPGDLSAKSPSSDVPAMTSGRAALVGLMHRYLEGLLDPILTLLAVHKLAYFMQEAGEPLRLRYVKAPNGPYAENLGKVLRRIDGHLISGYAGGGNEPDKRIELVPGAVEDAASFLIGHPGTRAKLGRVSGLVEGFETPFGLELLTSVHWVVTRENAAGMEEAQSKIYDWNAGKKRFTQRQIAIAYEALASEGWLAEAGSQATAN